MKQKTVSNKLSQQGIPEKDITTARRSSGISPAAKGMRRSGSRGASPYWALCRPANLIRLAGRPLFLTVSIGSYMQHERVIKPSMRTRAGVIMWLPHLKWPWRNARPDWHTPHWGVCQSLLHKVIKTIGRIFALTPCNNRRTFRQFVFASLQGFYDVSVFVVKPT